MAVRLSVRPRNRLCWAGWTIAPWIVAVGLVVSFVADAGQDPTIGATRFGMTVPGFGTPGDVLIEASLPDWTRPHDFALPQSDLVLHEARLLVGDVSHEAVPDEIDPKITVKAGADVFPAVDRSHKSDPNVGLRPTFDARLRSKGSLEVYRRAAITFDDSDPGAPPHELLPPAPAPGPESVARFEPMPDGSSITTKPSRAGASPGGGVAGATTPAVQDGSTPDVARAVALASATPAAADAIPVQIAPLPKFSRGPNGHIATDTTLVMGVIDTAPAFTALMDQARSSSEQRCLAEAIYFEARSEPEEGQAAVAQVVLNRVLSGLYPRTICGVVFQNHQRRNACQFSFACEGRALRINESTSWTQAVRVAREVIDGATYVSDVGGSTHYHANYVAPDWARRLVKMDRIGHHIFYKLRPGQT